HAPDVMVLDYSMAPHDAPGVIDQPLALDPEAKILVLTVHQNVHYAVRVLEAGAHGYLIKSAAVEELVSAIREVQAGKMYLSADISQEVLQRFRQPRRRREGLDALSPREFAFLRLLASGKSLQETAAAMEISTSTASTYRARILAKLQLSTTPELIRFAYENELDG
ncbi:MAG: response regulator transcription factor, partial [Planctomycetales bacterium]|nr:response regulator transcription factor [Planctomycetales bacterium]